MATHYITLEVRRVFLLDRLDRRYERTLENGLSFHADFMSHDRKHVSSALREKFGWFAGTWATLLAIFSEICSLLAS